MIAIRGLAAVAVLGTAALALNPLANAGPDRDSVTVAFTYDAAKAPLDNYLAFTRQAERACAERAVRTLDQRVFDRACAEDLIAQMVVAMGRADLADIHAIRTGRPGDSSRMRAAR